MWIWKQPPPIPDYRLDRMESYYVNGSRARQLAAQSPDGFFDLAKRKLSMLWKFYPLLGGICLLPALFLLKNDRWLALAMAATVAMLAVQLQLVHSFTFPHYIAPIGCLVYFALFQGLRFWSRMGRRQWMSRMVLPVVVVYSVVCLVAFGIESNRFRKPSPRQSIAARLEQMEGKHLVFVNYPKEHNVALEWVYNAADIDRADIVWANQLSDSENQNLIEYFDDRIAWQWEVGLREKGLARYKPALAGPAYPNP